jgi:hypothetical protein
VPCDPILLGRPLSEADEHGAGVNDAVLQTVHDFALNNSTRDLSQVSQLSDQIIQKPRVSYASAGLLHLSYAAWTTLTRSLHNPRQRKKKKAT